MVLLHCKACHHEWEGPEGSRCDWCQSESRVLDKTTPLGRMMRAIFGGKEVSKRAIICGCGLAKPCAKSDCQHSTAIALRNAEIKRVNSEVRVKRARTALAELQGDEFNDVMQHFCRWCGGEPRCSCMRDD